MARMLICMFVSSFVPKVVETHSRTHALTPSRRLSFLATIENNADVIFNIEKLSSPLFLFRFDRPVLTLRIIYYGAPASTSLDHIKRGHNMKSRI
eukprot:scaffold58325_cov56-Attheya_sp.AAC.2